MHHIFVKQNLIDFDNNRVVLDNEDENFKHLAKVLRIKKGELVLCSSVDTMSEFDYKTEVMDIEDDKIILTIVEKTEANELPVTINLYQGISKADKLEFIIEKAVELGVHSITPISTEYCVAKIDEKKSDKKIERFNKISKSAAEQSRRHIIPKVLEVVTFSDLLQNIRNVDGKVYNLLFYENADKIAKTKDILKSISDKNSKDITINVIIGPEGGFSDKEIELAKSHNIHILSLGDRILRTETAAITALSIIAYECDYGRAS